MSVRPLFLFLFFCFFMDLVSADFVDSNTPYGRCMTKYCWPGYDVCRDALCSKLYSGCSIPCGIYNNIGSACDRMCKDITDKKDKCSVEYGQKAYACFGGCYSKGADSHSCANKCGADARKKYLECQKEALATTTTSPPKVCNNNFVCETQHGENCMVCAGTNDCLCHDLLCRPGASGATSDGCFNPCLDVSNTYYDKKTDSCICKNGYLPDSSAEGCVTKNPCPRNMHWDGNECVCNTGYLNCDGIESTGCDVDSKSDKSNCGGCQKICGEGSRCRMGECVCINGYVMDDGGKCVEFRCNENDICEPEIGERCDACAPCICGINQVCDPIFIFPRSTDKRGCLHCEDYCMTYRENMFYQESDGKNCFCRCVPGYEWSNEGQKCMARTFEFEKTLLAINNRQPISPCMFMDYLRRVEDSNRRYGWEHITSKLHQGVYGYDTEYPLIDVGFWQMKLFRDGDANEGFEDVELIADYPPKFIVDKDGKKIDVSHSYAGVRAGLNRGMPSSWVMAKVNTDWGDLQQVYSAKISGHVGAFKAGFNEDLARLSGNTENQVKAAQEFTRNMRKVNTANAYRPDDQIRGNDLGMHLRSYLISNPEKRLSDAYDTYFRSIGENCI